MKDNGISRQLFLVMDGALVWLSFMITAILRDPVREILGYASSGGDTLQGLGVVTAVGMMLLPVLLEAFGFYRFSMSYRRQIGRLVKGVVLTVVVLAVMMVVQRVFSDSRFFILGLPVTLLILLGTRGWIVQRYLKKKYLTSSLKQSVQILGSAEAAESFIDGLSEERLALWDLQAPADVLQLETNDLIQILEERSVATVVFLAGNVEFSKVNETVELCESMGLETMLVTDFLRTKLSRPEIDMVGGRTMIALRSTPSLTYGVLAKKLLDRIGALALILATLPLWIVAAIGIRLKSPSGPIFFKQQRAGLYGRPFTMWKFRTMHVDAEAQLAKVKAEVGNQMDGPVFKLDNDPRVFSWGSFLRKTSIDELPQLINVWLGEISLVGPRPLPLYEVEEFQKSEHRRRLSVKPGITCFWQAGGRNTITSFEEWVEMDLRYIDNWSFWLDIKILLMTVPAVLLSRGAK